MIKALLLDRDGTINVDKGYVYKIEDFEFFKDTYEALKNFQKLGYKLFIVTNQSGIGRGYYTEKQLKVLNEWITEDLKKHGIKLFKIYYCPHFEKSKIKKYRKKCKCRKPGLKLFYKAIKEFDIDIDSSLVIGDKLSDLSICKVSNCKGILITRNKKMKQKNIYIAPNILSASLLAKRL